MASGIAPLYCKSCQCGCYGCSLKVADWDVIRWPVVEKSAKGNERRRLNALMKKKLPVPAALSSKVKLEQAKLNIMSKKGIA